MSGQLTCPQGHQWEAAPANAGPAVCPLCGAPAQSLTTAASTLNGPDRTPSFPYAVSNADTHPLMPKVVAAPAPPPTEPLSPASEATVAPEMASFDPGLSRVNVPGFEVLGELGRGGMGVVYRARHTALKRLVALKMILSGVHAGPQELARFRSEAQAVASLQHPNIVQIYEVDQHEGLPYFALEFIDGGSLAQRLDGRPQPARYAAELVETLARAVHHAHQHGIVHRDLKPANVLLTVDGTPKLTDFGLAKHLDNSDGPTRSGTVMGTPSYMAPEQAGDRAKAVGPHTDVYALGAILYEMLTGRPPFKADNPLDTVLQVLDHEPEQPRLYNREVNPSLEAICLKCLEKSPKDRYPSALALADDLAAYLRGEPVQADGSTSLRLFRLLLRETRHTEVMALWGRVWMWHAAQIFVLALLTDGLLTFLPGPLRKEAWPFVTLWAVGLLSLVVPVWYHRFRSGLPMTPVERQLGQLWGMFAAGFVLTLAVQYFGGDKVELEVTSLLPVLVLECGLAFGCMAIILGGSFYGLALSCGLLSVLLTFFPRFGTLVFAAVFAPALFLTGWKYSRAATKGRAAA
jgi:eukaryotic-like serine/threonine-protein kinase